MSFFLVVLTATLLVMLILPVAGCHQPKPSKILFTSIQSGNNREVYVMDADGSNQTNLTNDPAVDEYPYWSPDGNKIAFVSERDGNNEIYIMDADGSNLANLTNNPARDDTPAWFPDSKKIMFRSTRDVGWCGLYIMYTDGTDVAKLPLCLARDELWRLSPDGKKIAFERYREGTNKEDIWVLDIETGRETNLTNDPSGSEWPIWSPDGREIAFTSLRDGHGEVYVMDADGDNLRKVTTYSGAVPPPEQRGQVDSGYMGLAWSPDGEKLIAWLLDIDAQRWELCAIDKDGGNEVNLTCELSDGSMYPIGSWSPDGRRIVFSIWIPHLPDSDGLSEVWVVDADGSNLTRLTYKPGWDEVPTWQPR